MLSWHTHQNRPNQAKKREEGQGDFFNLLSPFFVFIETEKADIIAVGTGIQTRAFVLVNKELSHSDSSIYLVLDRP